MTFSQLEAAIYQWASVNSPIPVIFADENGVRPDTKYITIKIITSTPVGHPHLGDVDNNGDRDVLQNENFVLELNSFYKGSNDDLQILKDSLKKDAVMQSLADNEIVIRDENGSITDISTLLDDTTIEKRYLYEIRFSFCQTVSENVSYIGTVDIQKV